ncbi:MAG: hypothetical protein HGA87_01090 [Desulfobulbaceae bacterium]|nr:hypothetical protein [Desulfobulbaceae bacterium]
MEFEVTSFDDFLLLHDEKWHEQHNSHDYARSAWDEALKLAAKIAESEEQQLKLLVKMLLTTDAIHPPVVKGGWYEVHTSISPSDYHKMIAIVSQS